MRSPRCGSENYCKAGVVNGRQRFKCKGYVQLNPKVDKTTDIELHDYHHYLTWLENLSDAGKNIYQLVNNDIATLIKYVENSTGRGRVLAHNILCGLYEICIEDMPMRNGKLKNENERTNNAQFSTFNAQYIQVFPNPAREYTSFIWDFTPLNPTLNSNHYTLLTISDPTGKQLLTQPLEGPTGQWIWETANVPAGSYAYRVTCNGTQIDSGKIVVTK